MCRLTHPIRFLYDRHQSGSSPRTRGTLPKATALIFSPRFIPADAGNTKPYRSQYTRSSGSSPRTRGTPQDEAAVGKGDRFIPADAGNTWARKASTVVPAVHPRGRGEHVIARRWRTSEIGSSPRTRGTPVPVILDGQDQGFIPADAGNTSPACAKSGADAVHPRGRGEHRLNRLDPLLILGSSPRTRGTRPTSPIRADFRRFIPADAGNTNSARFPPRTAHGSSPRTRGTPIPHIA